MSAGFARLYDPLMAPLERFRLQGWRRELLASLQGQVLEVGAGTGANFPLYPPGLAVTALEPDPAMRARAVARARALGRDLPVVEAGVEALPFAEASFDAVVSTLVFCAVRDPARGLAELRRVLRPGGRLLMLEHTRSAHACLNCVLRGLTALTAPTMGEHFDRDTAALVREAGFGSVQVTYLGLQVFHRIEATRG